MEYLTLQYAKKLAARAIKYAKKKNWKISIAIVQNDNKLVYFERADKAFIGSVTNAIKKAETSNAYQRPTLTFQEALVKGRLDILSMSVSVVPGGRPIVVGGKHLGAIGISGASAFDDDECAKVALGIS